MGIDFLDLTYRAERVFEIKIRHAESIEFLASTVLEENRNDIRVCDFVAWVESRVYEQNPSYKGNVFEILRREIATCLAVEESDVTPEAWMVRDLGMG